MAIIAGVDEAGRGPLAGPVVAAAVILPEDHTIEGLRDSKKLSKLKREKLFPQIQEQAISIGLGAADVKTIDKINIREATLFAMQQALGRLSPRPEKALIDGHPLKNQIIPNEGIIGGDDLIDSIKAASIIAKVTRDNMMSDYAKIFPEYGFDKHAGYGTQFHMEALKEYKATPIHRRSFKPVNDQMPTLTWLSENNRVGWIGEKFAALYLKNMKYTVLEMNRNCPPHGEIDIIAKDQDELVFVEVKTGYKSNPETIDQKVDGVKQKRMSHAILEYNNTLEQIPEFRIDSISVILQKNKPLIKHFKGLLLDE